MSLLSRWASKLRQQRARPYSSTFRLSDKTQYRKWTDGSFRRDPVKLRGKAAVKRAKRNRQHRVIQIAAVL
jgi:hypothetical protein